MTMATTRTPNNDTIGIISSNGFMTRLDCRDRWDGLEEDDDDDELSRCASHNPSKKARHRQQGGREREKETGLIGPIKLATTEHSPNGWCTGRRLKLNYTHTLSLSLELLPKQVILAGNQMIIDCSAIKTIP